VTQEVSRYLRVRDVARELGVSVGRCYSLAREGRIPAVRQGRAVLIPAEAFERWWARRVDEALRAASSSDHSQ
jgi:excisionase family DNA binding protein